MTAAIALAERGLLPERWLRWGIRRLLRQRLAEPPRDPAGWLASMRASRVAPLPEKANAQHYALPPALFEAFLGPRLKYSCCRWDAGAADLAAAEVAALEQVAERALLADGQDVLDLGCGWGSLTLFVAERFPGSRVLAVSNSPAQRAFIEARSRERGLGNVRVLTRDANVLDLDARFDRVVSVEMLEHVRNWEALLGRVRGWLRPDGRLFVHYFAHRDRSYPFEEEGASNWMGREFFSGGMMPAQDLIEQVRIPFAVEARWAVSGANYARTAEAWLDNLAARRGAALDALAAAHGPGGARRALERWRLFFLACAELWGFDGGREWLVTHARLRPEGSA